MFAAWMLVWITSMVIYAAAAPLDIPQHLYIDDTMEEPQECFRTERYKDPRHINVQRCSNLMSTCGTTAHSPDFVPELGCVPAQQKICALNYKKDNNELEFACFCKGKICNALFKEDVRKSLIKFFADINKYKVPTSDYTDLFFKMIGTNAPKNYREVIDDSSRPEITIDEDLEQDQRVEEVTEKRSPRADALKDMQEEPISDDEDDTDEGSGAGEDVSMRPFVRGRNAYDHEVSIPTVSITPPAPDRSTLSPQVFTPLNCFTLVIIFLLK